MSLSCFSERFHIDGLVDECEIVRVALTLPASQTAEISPSLSCPSRPRASKYLSAFVSVQLCMFIVYTSLCMYTINFIAVAWNQPHKLHGYVIVACKTRPSTSAMCNAQTMEATMLLKIFNVLMFELPRTGFHFESFRHF